MKRKSYIIFAMTKLLVFVACTVQFFSHFFFTLLHSHTPTFMPLKKLILKKKFPSPIKVFKISLKLWKNCNLDYQPQLLTKYRSSRISHSYKIFVLFTNLLDKFRDVHLCRNYQLFLLMPATVDLKY